MQQTARLVLHANISEHLGINMDAIIKHNVSSQGDVFRRNKHQYHSRTQKIIILLCHVAAQSGQLLIDGSSFSILSPSKHSQL